MKEELDVVVCPYCRYLAKLVDSEIIYGKSYGMIYLCKPCDAYVGTHKNSGKPLGTLANGKLRKLRKSAHREFDPLWKSKLVSRPSAYKWLSKKLGIDGRDCHIAMFSIDQCNDVVDAVSELKRKVASFG